MGVNVRPEAVPPPSALRFPAAAIESVLGARVDRWALLADLLRVMMDLRGLMVRDAFVSIWNDHLAFKGQMVRLNLPDGREETAGVIGVAPDGRLCLTGGDGHVRRISAGEIEIAYN
jgi:biotin-(acetyl-CoA carboxylase) ligase